MSESPNGQLADGWIIHGRGGRRDRHGAPPLEVSYPGKLNYLGATWEMSKALVAIAALDGPLLRPLFLPLLAGLEATLRKAVGSICNRSKTEPSKTEPSEDEMSDAVSELESDLFYALKLIKALEAFPISSEGRFSSLGAPLLRELEATLRGILDVTAAWPPEANGRPTEAPTDRIELAAAPSENGRAPSGNETLLAKALALDAVAERLELVCDVLLEEATAGSNIGKTAREKTVKFFRENPKPEWKLLDDIKKAIGSTSDRVTRRRLQELVDCGMLEHQKGKGLWRLARLY